MSLPQIGRTAAGYITKADDVFDIVNVGSKAYTVGTGVAKAGSLAKVFSIGSKMTSWLGWGVLAFEGIQLVSDVVGGFFKDKGIDVKDDDLRRFINLHGELFVYTHILLNYDLSEKFTFNIFGVDLSQVTQDLNEDGRIDVIDLILKDIQTLPAENDSFKERVEDAISNNDVDGYIKTILAAKAGTPNFPNVIEALYKNWLSFCYDKNIWRAFPPAYQTRIQAIQKLVDDVYHIAIIDAHVSNYVHNYSEHSFRVIQEEILEQLPNSNDNKYDDIFKQRDFVWDVVPSVGSFR